MKKVVALFLLMFLVGCAGTVIDPGYHDAGDSHSDDHHNDHDDD